MTRFLFCYDTLGIRELFKRQCCELKKDVKCVSLYSDAIKESKTSSYDAFFLDFQNNLELSDVCYVADRIRDLQPNSLLIGVTMGYEKGYRERKHFDVIVNTIDILNPLKPKKLEKFLKKHNL